MQKTIKESQQEKLDEFSRLVKELTISLFKGKGTIGIKGLMFIPAEPSNQSSIKERKEGKSGLGICDLNSLFTNKEDYSSLYKDLELIFEEIRPTAFATVAEATMVECPIEDSRNIDGSIRKVSEFGNKKNIISITLESYNKCKFIIFEITNLFDLKLTKETEWENKSSTKVGGEAYNLLRKDYSSFGESLSENLKTNMN